MNDVIILKDKSPFQWFYMKENVNFYQIIVLEKNKNTSRRLE